MATEKRLIDANHIVKVAEHAYSEWNLAMAAADGQRQINQVYKMKELCKAVKAVADAAPTVDAVEVVHGEWLDGYSVDHAGHITKSIDCSVCEEVFRIVSHDREYWKERFKACPFCGAIMDGGRADA